MYVSMRILAAIGQHLFRSVIQHGGVYQALKKSPSEKPQEFAGRELSIIEKRVQDLESHAHSIISRLECLRERKSPKSMEGLDVRHSILTLALKVEVIKVRIGSLAGYFDRVMTSEWNKYISSNVNIMVNLMSSIYATYDAIKLLKVVKNPSLRLPSLHRYIPHFLYGWIRVNSYRWIPTWIHIAACYINCVTCRSAKSTRLALEPQIEHLRSLEIRMRSAATSVQEAHSMQR